MGQAQNLGHQFIQKIQIIGLMAYSILHRTVSIHLPQQVAGQTHKWKSSIRETV